MRRIVYAGLSLLVAGVIAYFVLFRDPVPPPPPPPPPAPTPFLAVVRDMAEFQKQLAAAAQVKFPDPGLQIVPIDDDPPIGTLYLPSRTLEANDHSCVPTVPPTERRNSTFPSYQASSGLSAALGVDEGVLEALGQAGASVDRGQSIRISFAEQTRAYLDDDRLKQLLKDPACVAALADGPFEMVRGHFRARRVFQLAATGAGAFNAGKVASFDAKRTSQAAVELSDPEPVGFLQLRTRVELTPTNAAPSITMAPSTILAQKIVVPNPSGALLTRRIELKLDKPVPSTAAHGRIYVQRDARDTSGTDRLVVDKLVAANLPVVAKVEAIASAKVPSRPEIRYFNSGDAGLARETAAMLAPVLGEAKIAQIPLRSPPGQLEIWLARVR